MKLFTTGNPKLMKGEKKGYLSFVLHLAPADLSGHNTCPKATAGCKQACLNTAGRGGIFKKGESCLLYTSPSPRDGLLFSSFP